MIERICIVLAGVMLVGCAATQDRTSSPASRVGAYIYAKPVLDPDPDQGEADELQLHAALYGKGELLVGTTPTWQWRMEPEQADLLQGAGAGFSSVVSCGPPTTVPTFLAKIFVTSA